MNIEGLDALDNKILEELKNNARATFSEIGEVVGLSRVAVKNRIEVMEKNGVIQGYKAIIDKTKVSQGVQFIIDVEAIPELSFTEILFYSLLNGKFIFKERWQDVRIIDSVKWLFVDITILEKIMGRL